MFGGGNGGEKGLLMCNFTEEMAATIIQTWFRKRIRIQREMDMALNEDKSLILSFYSDIGIKR